MAEVFISYKSERRRAAEHVAAVLERHGYSVWFDYQLIKGRDFGLQIDRKVREAKALVALWCSMSVSSRWVAEEVDLAHHLGILVPVKIEACELPVGFRRQDYVSLTEWDGAPRSHQLDPLLDALEQKVGRAPAPDFKTLRDYEATWRRFGAPPLRAFALDQPLQDHEGDRGLPGSMRQQGLDVTPRSNDKMPSFSATGPAHDYEFWERQWERYGTSDNLIAVRDIAIFANQARARFAEIEAVQQQQARGRERQRVEEERLAAFRAEGRIKVDVEIFHGDNEAAQDGWFKPGAGKTEWFKDLDTGPDMIVVPAGEYLMGSPEGEGADTERPQHKVTIAKPFAVSIAPITRGEFSAFIRETDRDIEIGAHVGHGIAWRKDSNKSWRDPGFKQDDDHPVVCVNWHDARAYAAWLSERSGKSYRLLSEAEWEYCCRAGTKSQYCTGDDITAKQANFGGNAGGTTPVLKFAANAWGLRDMHGNVLEWCEDNRHPTYERAPQDGSVWKGGDESSRVLRSCSWGFDPQCLRSAIRYAGRPDDRIDVIGFRVARTL